MQPKTLGLVLVTAASKAEAEAIAQHLVTHHLAACVSLQPIHSIYSWQDTLHHDDEWQLVIKTDLGLFADIEAAVRAIHSYDVPEIVGIPFTVGSQDYLTWVASQTQAP
ncbi:MAG: divalent-cation tolerance protein CutA [Kaiparowitsia implicata GSE-PSE-MK54-09C]|nr:divalent-cation tolerance protein CutA [Kaiparowitsia implicata GSE-PSE-MK54-09C]